MQVFTTVESLHSYIHENPNLGRLAFIPTLGALHQGHLALMQRGQDHCDSIVVSIFVNPTQFNNPKDLEKYPRPLANDIYLLEKQNADILFLPKNEEIYPDGLNMHVPIDVSHLTTVLEGPNRPGHFEGVVTVVKRLLDIVKPHCLIMGQKDYQQQAIIGEMIRQLKMPVELITHPTIREPSGLAMSSRNVRIDPKLRPLAPTLYQTLLEAKKMYPRYTPKQIESHCGKKILDAGFNLEYFSLVHSSSLQSVTQWGDATSTVACVAAWLGDIRLIDNMILY